MIDNKERISVILKLVNLFDDSISEVIVEYDKQNASTQDIKDNLKDVFKNKIKFKDDIFKWIETSNGSILFIETAILYQSGLDKIVDEVWEVTAPMELRINRVMSRNNISRQDVISRIKSQQIQIENPHPNIKQIVNDLHTPIIPQILKLI